MTEEPQFNDWLVDVIDKAHKLTKKCADLSAKGEASQFELQKEMSYLEGVLYTALEAIRPRDGMPEEKQRGLLGRILP